MDVVPPNPNTFPIHEEESPPSGYAHESGSSPVVQQQDTPQQHELWSKTVTLSRGRAPGDPHARTVNFHCQNVDDLRTCLRDHRATPNPEYPPEHTTVELIFPISAAFLVSDPFGVTQPGPKLSQASKALHSLYGTPNSTMISVMEAMTPMPDPKDNMKKQRVIAKACVEAIQRADGNRYTFHNNWWSKEDEANRFSYYCNDSILNKGRSANGGAGTIGQKVQKPVYDCKGIIAVKFSAVKQNLQVQYKHVPVHKSYEERAPPPRRGTNRWKLAELHNPESLVRRRQPKSPQPADSSQRKRKRRASNQRATDALDEDLALESTQPLLQLTTPAADHLTAGPSSTRGPRVKDCRKSKCTMCQTKKAKCDGKLPCSNYAERPLICADPIEASENLHVPELEPEASLQPESESAPGGAAAGPTPRRKSKTASPVAPKSPHRNVQKELKEAASELEMLKTKLAQAEERVRSLEAEKEIRELGSAARRVKLPTNYASQTQSESSGRGIMQPMGQTPSTQAEPPPWQVMLPNDYASAQSKRKN